MSLLPAEVHSALSQLLHGLMTSDNTVRSQAEEQLNNDWIQNRPDVLLMGLVEQIQGAEPGIRSFAAVLFRRIATKTRKDPVTNEAKELFSTLTGEQRLVIRQKLVTCLTTESVADVRRKVGDSVAEIARQYTDNGDQWPELLGVLFQASQSPDAGLREAAYRIFSTTPGIIEKNHEDAVLNVFGKGFKDDVVSVRISALEAFASFFRSISKKSQPKFFPLVADLLNILPPLKESGESEDLSAAFMSLIELAEISPKMFKAMFNNLVTFSVSVVAEKDLSDQVRQNALELMATFADYAPNMCKKNEKFAQEMVTQCLSLMTDIGIDDDDASEWNSSEDLDLEESDLNHVAGEQCMDRLANKLGGQVILPATFAWIPSMMSSSAWRDRHAALMAISAISEGCRDLMVGELDQVLALIVPALQDPHPRVRYAGCNALGQMSTDFAGTMQEKYHQVVLNNIIPVLDSAEPRVQAHAAAALVNFCEEAERKVLEPYLDNLLRHLLQLLRSDKRYVQEQALSTIATIADSAENAFDQYYSTLMPLLFNVLKEEQSKEYRLLRAKAMECATLIALAVGKNKMGQDALNLVQLLGNIQQNIVDADDPQSQYLLHCWGRMCRVLGQDFVPYLPGVMPPLLTVAAARADIQLLDDENQIEQVEQDEGWELVPLKGKVIGIKTSALEDKNTAIELITIYAQFLEAAFEPYVLETMEKIAVPGLAFFFHDPVRVSSAKLVPQLLNSYKKAHGEQSPGFAQMWNKVAEKIIEVLSAEPTVDTLAEMYQCFYESVEVVGKNCLSLQHLQAFITSAKSTLEDYQLRVKQRLEERADLEEGEEESLDYEYAVEDDQNLLSDMNKAFHTIFKNQGTSFLPSWETLMPFYDAFITSEDPTQRQWALCIMDDVLEFCGDDAWKYKDHIMRPLAAGLQDQNAANRQAAAYGVGVAAQKGGAAWADFVAACLPSLLQATQIPQSRSEEHVFATENASASIAKILHFNASKVQNAPDVVASWLTTLPITFDEEAAPYAYFFLAQLIEQQNPVVMANADKVFGFIVAALEAETLQGQTAGRVANAAKQLVGATGVNADQILAGVNPDNQAAVRSYFQ
ncbi:putative importin beta-3 subunit [Aspergillus campestris IBT 28561]|uniref:Importin beta-3 subunit n=1 Tax=Aspergillus campestris (strain IBT 28561) TaxID=1392248 RepID=A0A2I1D2F4_ASPC2|nr:putative importin beta-3 subunit [Aspergillus campestris IBT 28561]PKY04072.1 putative importin beta-3 subunit [Aspergillus campestris IBT 28561]